MHSEILDGLELHAGGVGLGRPACEAARILGMSKIKTQPTGADVTAFLDSVPDERRRRSDGQALLTLMQLSPGRRPRDADVDCRIQQSTNTTGTNDWFVVGFIRKNAMTLYGIYDGYGPAIPALDDLGPHTTGRGCLYIKRLNEVNEKVLSEMVRHAWERAHQST